MNQIDELLRRGNEVLESMKPVKLTEDNSFVYDFSDAEVFAEWRDDVINAIHDEKIAGLLKDAQRGQLLPEQIGKVLVALRMMAGGMDVGVSPLAPRSTDIE